MWSGKSDIITTLWMIYLSVRILNDLYRLGACRPYPPKLGVSVPKELGSSTTPLCWRTGEKLLDTYPDLFFRDYIVGGIETGFRVGFRFSYQCRSASRHMYSAREHPEIIRDYLAKECAAGRALGPFSLDAFPGIQISRFGVIPKKVPGNGD